MAGMYNPSSASSPAATKVASDIPNFIFRARNERTIKIG
jgi:hypothetical protein